jgi:hypothetical protein
MIFQRRLFWRAPAIIAVAAWAYLHCVSQGSKGFFRYFRRLRPAHVGQH